MVSRLDGYQRHKERRRLIDVIIYIASCIPVPATIVEGYQMAVEASQSTIKTRITSTPFAYCANVRYDILLVSSLLHRGGAMPTVRKLTPDDVKALQDKHKGPRKLVE